MSVFHQGDIVWLDFDPQTGHEQGKRRPALIVSGNDALELLKPMASVCPITGNSKPFPAHVPLDGRTKTHGVIMCEQHKSLDLDARNAAFIERAPAEIAREAVDIIHSIYD